MTFLTDGSARAHCDVAHQGRLLTFRLSVQDEPERLIMKLEGKIVGAWATECRDAWTALRPLVSTRKLALDLCGVTFIDESGLELLREIQRTTRADMLTNSPLTRHFAEMAEAPTANRIKGD